MFVLLQFETKVDKVVNHMNCDSKYHVTYKFASTFIQLVTTVNLLPYKVVQK